MGEKSLPSGSLRSTSLSMGFFEARCVLDGRMSEDRLGVFDGVSLPGQRADLANVDIVGGGLS